MIEINGILYSDDIKLLINCSDLTMSGNLVIPERVEYINPQAFQGSNLNSIQFHMSACCRVSKVYGLAFTMH